MAHEHLLSHFEYQPALQINDESLFMSITLPVADPGDDLGANGGGPPRGQTKKKKKEIF